MGEEFPQNARIKQSEEFRRIQKSGRRFHTKHFIVCSSVPSEPTCRFGLTVSRKVGNAVVRNRVKRLLRESIRRSRAGWSGGDVVFIAKTTSASATQSEVLQQVQDAFARIQRGRR